MHKLMESMCNPEIFLVLGGAPPALQALGARLVSDPALIAKLTAEPSLQNLLSELLADPALLESVVHNDEARALNHTSRAHACSSRSALWAPCAQLVSTLTSLVERLEAGDDSSFEATVQLFRSGIAKNTPALSKSSDPNREGADPDRPQGRAHSEPPLAIVSRPNPADSFALYAVHDILSECARELLRSAWARWHSTRPQSKRAAGGANDESAALRAHVAALEAELLQVRSGGRASLLRPVRDFSECVDLGAGLGRRVLHLQRRSPCVMPAVGIFRFWRAVFDALHSACRTASSWR